MPHTPGTLNQIGLPALFCTGIGSVQSLTLLPLGFLVSQRSGRTCTPARPDRCRHPLLGCKCKRACSALMPWSLLRLPGRVSAAPVALPGASLRSPDRSDHLACVPSRRLTISDGLYADVKHLLAQVAAPGAAWPAE